MRKKFESSKISKIDAILLYKRVLQIELLFNYLK